MTSTLTASMRRMNQVMGPANLIRETRSLQIAMTGFLVDSALAPLAALAPKPAKRRKIAVPKAGGALGDVIKKPRATHSLEPGATAGSSGHEPSPRIPKGGQYLTRKHRSTTGMRDYKLYLPASQPKSPKGLILMLHGCRQTPDDFALGTDMNALAEQHGLAVAYPAQTRRHNAASCWNWFKPCNQMRSMGEPAILASLTRKLMREFGLGRDVVYVAGLSAGGAMAAILADVYPDIFSAAGVHSGLARGAASDVVSAMSAMQRGGTSNGITLFTASSSSPVRRIIFQGEDDQTVNPSNASQIVAAEVGDDAAPTKIGKRTVRGRGYCRSDFADSDGTTQIELWMIEGSGHAWSGGRAEGSYTDTKGPDASAQMVRFFLADDG